MLAAVKDGTDYGLAFWILVASALLFFVAAFIQEVKAFGRVTVQWAWLAAFGFVLGFLGLTYWGW